MTRIRVIAALGFALAAVTALPAGSAPATSHIVYRCGPGFSNLCKIDPASGVVTRLTRDGKPGGPLYAEPSYSRDGAKMTFTFGNDLYVARGDATHRRMLERRVVLDRHQPGRQVGHSGQDPAGPRRRALPWLHLRREVDPLPLHPPRRPRQAGDRGAGGRDGRLVAGTAHDRPTEERRGGAVDLRPPRRTPTTTALATLPSTPIRDLWGPAGSPNGRYIAAAAAPRPGPNETATKLDGYIALYSSGHGAARAKPHPRPARLVSDVVAGQFADRLQPRPQHLRHPRRRQRRRAPALARALRHSADLGGLTLRRAGALTALALQPVACSHRRSERRRTSSASGGRAVRETVSSRRSAASRPTRDGHVFAADSKGRIEKFTTAGGFVRSIGAPPSPVDEDRRDPVSGRRRRGAERKSLRGRVLEPDSRLGVVPDRSLHDLLRATAARATGSSPCRARSRSMPAVPSTSRTPAIIGSRSSRPTAATSPRSGAARGCSSRRTSSRRRAESRLLRTGASTRATSSTGASSTTPPTAASSAVSGSSAAAPGQFQAPVGVAVAGDGSVWVADRSLSTVQRFSASGRPLETLGRPGSGDGCVQPPHLRDAGLQGIALRCRRRQPPSPALRRSRCGLVRQRSRRPERAAGGARDGRCNDSTSPGSSRSC